MSEAVRVAVGRRRSRVEADRLVLEFEHSGLTRQAFCAQHGLSLAALDTYRRRCSKKLMPAQPQASDNRILPVEFVNRAADARACAVDSSRALRVELSNGRRIEVAQGFDAPTLQRLVSALEKA
jgi:hypothetical protein